MQIVDANHNPLTREQVLEACELNQVHPATVNSRFNDVTEQVIDTSWIGRRSSDQRDPAEILGDYEMSLLTKLRNHV